MTAVLTILIGAAGLVVGWFVLGTQQVNETSAEKRRIAYLTLIRAAVKY